MYRSCFIAIAAVICMSGASAGAQAGPYPFGDEPYRLNWYSDPEIANGCWKWNWQQYQWDNYCPVYVHPKAFMYPRARPVVVRTKG